MKKSIFTVLLFCCANFLDAHDINYEHVSLHHWNIQSEHKAIDGSFYMMKDGRVYIETSDHGIVNFPLKSLSTDDALFAINKENNIALLNARLQYSTFTPTKQTNSTGKYITLIALLFCTSIIIVRFTVRKQWKYMIPLIVAGVSFTLYSFTKSLMQTSPATIDAAFAPFVPEVHTFYDSTYFWVESKGIPTTHPMMTGIASNGWQRQVPIPQCYMGTNAWPIPLKPVMASNPIPVDAIHFTRGAIAIAVNGVPIFNEHTNTGADAFTSGQLDAYGGHCGRGDDYHYHIAPLHLYSHTASTLPIAYALDGFAVFGSNEPDGSAMQTLDANHGHFFNGVYHYHGTSTYPYMIGNMAGQVTEDATHQLIPQAAAHPVRAGQNPLNGALITACNPNSAGNGYTLIYTYQGNTDSVVYFWDAAGNYTFKYYTAGNLDSTETKHGFVQCTVPATINSVLNISSKDELLIYPNPVNNLVVCQVVVDQIKKIELFATDGRQINCAYNLEKSKCIIDASHLPTGLYLVKITDSKDVNHVSKFVKE